MSNKEVASKQQLINEELNKENIQKQDSLKQQVSQKEQIDLYSSLVKKIYVVIEY